MWNFLDVTQHDRLFKELLRACFLEFLQLFAPDLAALLDAHRFVFIDRELFSDRRFGRTLEPDLVVRVPCSGIETEILVHIEHQAQPQADFARRMFLYFARLHEQHQVPVIPIALFSHDFVRPEPRSYCVGIPNRRVLHFEYQAIQLNRIPWRKYLHSKNPVAAALMARMNFAPAERPRVKLECLRGLLRSHPDPARQRLISGFIDTYLPLNRQETLQFDCAVDSLLRGDEKEGVMEITTSWKREGLAQGLERGLEQGLERGLKKGRALGRREGRKAALTTIVERLLTHQLPAVPVSDDPRLHRLPITALEQLAVDLLHFHSADDFEAWLHRRSRR